MNFIFNEKLYCIIVITNSQILEFQNTLEGRSLSGVLSPISRTLYRWPLTSIPLCKIQILSSKCNLWWWWCAQPLWLHHQKP